VVISTRSENQPCSGVLHRLKSVHELLRQTSKSRSLHLWRSNFTLFSADHIETSEDGLLLSAGDMSPYFVRTFWGFPEKFPLFRHLLKNIILHVILIGSGLLTGSGSDAEKDLMCQNIPASHVAGLLKKFLRELPDSVIPEQSYQSFIDAAST